MVLRPWGWPPVWASCGSLQLLSGVLLSRPITGGLTRFICDTRDRLHGGVLRHTTNPPSDTPPKLSRGRAAGRIVMGVDIGGPKGERGGIWLATVGEERQAMTVAPLILKF